jgi:hypothetical protein
VEVFAVWKRVAVAVLLVVLWAGVVDARSRVCACAPGAGGGGPGMPNTSGWVRLPSGLLVPPEAVAAVGEVATTVKVQTWWETIRLYRDVIAFLASAGGYVASQWHRWSEARRADEIYRMRIDMREHLQGRAYEFH